MEIGVCAWLRARSLLLACTLIYPCLSLPLPVHASEPRQILVIGDSLSQGLAVGLGVCFQNVQNIKIVPKGKISTGLTLKRPIDWTIEAPKLAASQRYAAVVVQIGANDIMPIWADGAHAFGSPRWKQEYGAKVAKIAQAFQANGTQVFWVGLPLVRRPDYAAAYAQINEAVRAAIGAGPAKFHDIWDAFQDGGEFTSYGEDVAGNKVVIRADDGTHFTHPGYVKEASLIVPDIAAELGLDAVACQP